MMKKEPRTIRYHTICEQVAPKVEEVAKPLLLVACSDEVFRSLTQCRPKTPRFLFATDQLHCGTWLEIMDVFSGMVMRNRHVYRVRRWAPKSGRLATIFIRQYGGPYLSKDIGQWF